MKLLTTVLFVLLSVSCFSQNLEKVAEIEVSEDTKVYTFKLTEQQNTTIKDYDVSEKLNVEQQRIVNHFLTINGVSRASFDNATKTFTVLAKKNTIIALPLTLK